MLFLSQPVELFHLVDVVHYDSANAIIQRHVQLFGGFVVAVEAGVFYIKASLYGGVQFTAGNHVDSHLFRLHHTVDLLAGKRLAGIANQSLSVIVGLHALAEDTAVPPDHVLIHDIERGSVLFCQCDGIHTADGQIALSVYAQIVRYKHFFFLSFVCFGACGNHCADASSSGSESSLSAAISSKTACTSSTPSRVTAEKGMI